METSAVKINKAKAVNGISHFKTIVTARQHEIISDEPQKSGGNDEGPSPHELLVASLASCIAITLRMYADRKKWQLNIVEVDAEMQRMTDAGIQSNKIILKISLNGNLDDEQRKRLLEISTKCPVSKTLSSSFTISEELVQ